MDYDKPFVGSQIEHASLNIHRTKVDIPLTFSKDMDVYRDVIIVWNRASDIDHTSSQGGSWIPCNKQFPVPEMCAPKIPGDYYLTRIFFMC
jgi:hypothetical protein